MPERHYKLGCLLVPLLTASAAFAENEDVIAHCAKIGSVGDRILCLEDALRQASSGDIEVAQEDTTEAVESDIGVEQVEARTATREELIAGLKTASGVRVVVYSEVPYRRLQVELENGQVWRQIKGDTQQIRVDLGRNQTVDIAESSMGGYKLRLNEIRRTIRVERIR
ncbi:MAG: hypothetical protein ACE5FV_06930 [Woeseia sp.]